MYYLTKAGVKFLNEDVDKFKKQMILNRAFYRFKKGLPPGDFTRRDKSQIDQLTSMQSIADKQKIEAAARLAADRRRGTSGGT